MSYCWKCGVKLDNNINKCPLCDVKVPTSDSDSVDKHYPEYSPEVSMSNRQKRFIAWQLLTLIFSISFLVVLTANLFQRGALSWAGYPMTAIGMAWLISTLILFCFKSPMVIITGNFIALSGFLALLDMLDGQLQWFLVLGLPILGATTLIASLLYLFIRFFKNRVVLFIAFFLLLLIPYCIGINLLSTGYLGSVRLSWSLFFTIAVFPLSLLLIWYDFFLKKRVNLKKFFHL